MLVSKLVQVGANWKAVISAEGHTVTETAIYESEESAAMAADALINWVENHEDRQDLDRKIRELVSGNEEGDHSNLIEYMEAKCQ